MAGSPDKSFAIVGDASLVYPLLGQVPPYHVQLYDASRRREQQKVVDDMRARRPKFLLWRRDVYIDGVPPEVRTPLIFREMVASYVPVVRAPAFDVLRRRDGAPLPHTYWRQSLGGRELDLAGIPASSSADEAPRCAGGAGCAAYAMVQGPVTRDGEKIHVRVSGGGESFPVSFFTRKGVATYPIRLDRVWFRDLLGPSVSVQSTTPGWTARVASVATGHDLY
jgi:hypothetical protein